MPQPVQQPKAALTGSAKREAVARLLGKLKEDLDDASLLPSQRDAALEELKIFSRDPAGSDLMYTKEGLETLARHAFRGPTSKTSHLAMACIANSMVLKEETRQKFVDLGLEAKVCGMLKNDSLDDEFLVGRILLFTTYKTTLDIDALIEKHHLAEYMISNLSRHEKRISEGASSASANPMEEIALTETLKVLFSVTSGSPERAKPFTPAIQHIIPMLCKRDVPANDPVGPPLGQMVHTLVNLDLRSKEASSWLYPSHDANSPAEKLIQILEAVAAKPYSDSELETTATPLVMVIDKLHESAPDDVRALIRSKLLPTEEDRRQVLGRGGSLSSWLLRNSVNPMTPKLRVSISHLQFNMSDQDASKFVDNVGYGYASGFLFQKGIAVPPPSEATSTGARGEHVRPINPITGQFLDLEPAEELPPMTEEEKEREAERLFVAFEKLNRNGIFRVQNPVERAFQEGRIQELPDDAEEESD